MEEAIAQLFAPIWRLATLAGPVVWVLAAMAVLGLAIIGLKLGQFIWFALADRRRLRVAHEFWRDGHLNSALRVLDRVRHPLGPMLSLAMRAEPGIVQPMLREELQRLGEQASARLHAALRTLDLVAVTAPLVGLLGTVLGMIEAFRELEAAGPQVDPAVLSSGIWQALLTTAIGLVVAIPCTLAHGWLEQRAEDGTRRIEDAVTQIFTWPLQRLVQPGQGTPHLQDSPQQAELTLADAAPEVWRRRS